ncbi:MAG: hypothetical protein AAFS10_09740, partial [Myxococcota bacterium]
MREAEHSSTSDVVVQRQENGALERTPSEKTPCEALVQMKQASGVTGSALLERLLQFKAPAGGPTGAQAHTIATQGLSGAPERLPHLDAIQRSFGRHDVSAVQTYSGAQAGQAASALGARAYA